MQLLFKDLSEKDVNEGIRSLIAESTARPSFFFLMNMSSIMATLGLLLNNSSIIIGSMLVAPLLSPILALTMGLNTKDGKLILRSSKTIGKSVLSSIFFSLLTAMVFAQFSHSVITDGKFNSEIISRTSVNLLFFFVALVAGATTAFARMKPKLNETLPGTAIAIALVPPVAVMGIGIKFLNFSIVGGAFTMFLANMIGIILGAYLIFSQLEIEKKERIIKSERRKADKELRKMVEEHEEEKIEEKIESLKENLGIEKIEES